MILSHFGNLHITRSVTETNRTERACMTTSEAKRGDELERDQINQTQTRSMPRCGGAIHTIRWKDIMMERVNGEMERIP